MHTGSFLPAGAAGSGNQAWVLLACDGWAAGGDGDAGLQPCPCPASGGVQLAGVGAQREAAFPGGEDVTAVSCVWATLIHQASALGSGAPRGGASAHCRQQQGSWKEGV